MQHKPSKQTIRDLYEKSVNSKLHTRNLLKLLEKQEQTPFIVGYTGATKMLMAKHLLNPFQKLSQFNTGKKMLNRAIVANEAEIEIVFLRYASQMHAPSILGYNGEMSADKKLIIKWLSTNDSKDERLVNLISSFMKQQN